MKKFSLKALGAILFGFALAVSTLVAPANAAATAAWNGTAPTFTTGLSPAMNINFNTTSPAQFTEVSISIRNEGGTAVPNGVTTIATNGDCKITSLAGDQVRRNGTTCQRYDSSDALGSRIGYPVLNDALDDWASGSFNLQVQAGVFDGLANGSYTLWVGTIAGSLVESALIPFTIGPPPTPSISPSSFSINGTAGTSITSTAGFTASNFVGSVTYAAPSRPAGLSINTSTGVISGTPTNSGSGTFTVTATGATSGSAQSTVSFSFGSSSGGDGNAPAATLSLAATQGQLLAGSSVGIVASGLQSTAPYTVVVRSTPQTIGTGNAVNGAVNTSVTLPAGLSAGWHSLTFSSTAADGSAVTSVLYFEVSASGTLLATSSTIPAALANTGFDGTPYLAGGLALAVVGGSLMLIARRKATH